MIFRYNYKSNDAFYSPNSFELPFRLKGTEKIHTERLSKFPSNIYSILYASDPETSDSTNLKLTKVKQYNIGPGQTSDKNKLRTKEKKLFEF